MLVSFVVDIPEVSGLELWNNQTVARVEWVDIQDDDSLIILVDFVAWDFPLYNLCKY